MRWLEITLDTEHEKTELLAQELEELGVPGLIIEDEAEYSEFLENNRQYWDYIDEELERSIKGLCRLKFYFEDSEDGAAMFEKVRSALPGESFSVSTVRDEDWENNWRKYYKPIVTGEKLIVVPEWEEIPSGTGRSVLRLEPGLIFGTGSHATTRMCLETLEELCSGGEKVLDLGCGSGILGIAALVLGAERAVGCDIDGKAPDVVIENGRLNGFGGDRLKVYAGDVLADGRLVKKLSEEKYDIVLANIVADVIIALAPQICGYLAENGAFVCSGIIEGRQDEVRAALERAGLSITGCKNREGWHCFSAVRRIGD